MTIKEDMSANANCPAEHLLKIVSGRWKPMIVRLALSEPVRFSELLRKLEGVNRQSLAVALKELYEAEILEKNVIRQKPLHIEYRLTEKGNMLAGMLRQLEGLT